MKFFGEYLVEKKIITTDQLVKALVEQNTKLPTVAQIAFEKKFIHSNEILQIFKTQFEKKTGFIEAARELNLWNDQLQQETEKYIGALRVPLGQILVETASIPLESITHALDNFLSDIDAPSIEKENVTITATTTDANYSNYCDILNLNRKEALLSSISLMKVGDVSFSPLKTLKEILHLMKSAATFSIVNRSESIISTMESIMDLIVSIEVGKISADFIVLTGVAFEKNVNLLWEISENLQKGISEEEMLQSPEFKMNFEAISASVEMIKFDLELIA